MHGYALILDFVLGLVEFLVIHKALRTWLEASGWMLGLAAAAATYFPIVGGIAALVAAIAILEWRWWIACGLFIGGTAALAYMGGLNALWDQGALF